MSVPSIKWEVNDELLKEVSSRVFVFFRVISWIVCFYVLRRIHEITRNLTKEDGIIGAQASLPADQSLENTLKLKISRRLEIA